MGSLDTAWRNLRAFLLGLIKRSFAAHGSLRVSDKARSLDFYQRLGFRRVTATRGGEVILLRNHQGDEINLVPNAAESNLELSTDSVVIAVEHLDVEVSRLRSVQPDLEIAEDGFARRVRVTDPDGNHIEFYEQLDTRSAPQARIYHVATESELAAGLSQDYYLPPNEENRFVRARAHAALLTLTCNRVASATTAVPLIVELNDHLLSIESQLLDDSEFDSAKPGADSAYPRVNSPIPREAITGVGVCREKNGDYLWPESFASLDHVTGLSDSNR